MKTQFRFTNSAATGSHLRQGFILVSVLLIVALATILVVVASMMSQIERRAASNSAKIEQARANALFALDVAVNQLQTAAGPDQRITARAEILDATNAPPLSTNNNVKQPLWTGVWKTGTNQLDVGSAPQRKTSLGSLTPTTADKVTNASWLVSGTNPDPTTFTGVTSGTNATAAVLANNLGTNAISVIAPLVPVLAKSGASTVTNGAYAYWVSDEGVKAKVNRVDPTLGASASGDPSRSQLHFTGPQAVAAYKGIPAFGSTDIRGNTNVSKVASLAALNNLNGLSSFSSTNASQSSADITVHSLGVLADARRGGLKKDLTAAFESNSAFTAMSSNATYGFGAQMVYRTASSAGLSTPAIDTGVQPPSDGLFWHNLFFHYNSYKASMSAPSATSTGGNTPLTPTSSGSPGALPQILSNRVYSINPNSTAVKLSGLVPVPVAYRVDIAMSSYQSAGTWKLRLHYYPQLLLWNPYGVRLNLSNYQFQRNVGAFSTAGSYNGANSTLTCIQVKATSGNTTTTIPYFKVNQTPSTAGGRLTLKTNSIDCQMLEPGETRFFALDNDATFPSPTAAISFTNLTSNLNTSGDFSQQCDVLVGNDGNGTSTGAAYSSPDPNTVINVSITSPNLRCQNVDTFANPSGLKWPWNDGAVRYMAGGNWNLPAATSSWPAGLTISQLNSAPRRIIGFYVRQKGLKTSSSTFSYSNAANSVPIFMGNSATLNPVEDMYCFAWQEVYLSPLGTVYTNGQTDVQVIQSGANLESSVGNQSAGVSAPGPRYVLRDVPSQPLVSLGQFMHMPAANFNSIGNYQQMGMGSMFVGGSYASPVIASTDNALSFVISTSTSGVTSSHIFLDDSFLANEALFDRFFFSTVPPQSLPGNAPATWVAFNSANSGSSLSDATKPLLNSCMKPYFKNGAAAKLSDLRDMDKAAANLLLDGAFNINSTSVSAWKAFLGGLSGNDLRVWNATSKQALSIASSPASTLIPRFWSASGTTVPNAAWSGIRVLSDVELNELATRIVEQVKRRGPFLSLADFFNRRLGVAGPLTLSGALQAAIDSTSPDVNATVKASGNTVNASAPPEAGKVPALITSNMVDAQGRSWNTAIGLPGYLMQQDLVQAYSPLMCPRSDTFLVRTYGENRNPKTGLVEGKAWGEAVVQRLPDLMDDSQPPETLLTDMNGTNKNLGRRFKIVSFRWLNDNEI